MQPILSLFLWFSTQFISEAMEMRRKKQEAGKPPPKPVVRSPRPMHAYT